MSKNSINKKKKLASLSSDNLPSTLRKRKKYKEFVRMIRNGELEYFYKMAKKIGVNRETIARWYNTKPAQNAADQEAEEFVGKLKLPKPTWRDSARLIDRFLKA